MSPKTLFLTSSATPEVRRDFIHKMGLKENTVTQVIRSVNRPNNYYAVERFLSDNEKEQYQAIVALHNGKYSMDENILTSRIYILSHLLHRHYGQ